MSKQMLMMMHDLILLWYMDFDRQKMASTSTKMLRIWWDKLNFYVV